MRIGVKSEVDLISNEVEAVDTLYSYGFPGIEKPMGDYPILTEDHADLNPRDLGELHNRFTRWFEYASYRLCVLKTVALGRQEKYDDSLRIAMANLTGSQEERKRKALLDEVIRNLRRDAIRSQQEALLVEGVVTRLKYNMTVTSRLVTIRQEEIRANLREYNVGRTTSDNIMDRI